MRTLTVGSFDFGNRIVIVEAIDAKGKREDALTLRKDTAAILREFFKGKMPRVKAFGGTGIKLTAYTGKMLKADLEDTEIRDAAGKIVREAVPFVDAAGRYADFHSLRHTTGTLLAAAGAHPKVVQKIMRHTDINLTMSLYTHVLKGQESQAVDALPDLSAQDSQTMRETGTDDLQADSQEFGGQSRTSVDSHGHKKPRNKPRPRFQAVSKPLS